MVAPLGPGVGAGGGSCSVWGRRRDRTPGVMIGWGMVIAVVAVVILPITGRVVIPSLNGGQPWTLLGRMITLWKDVSQALLDIIGCPHSAWLWERAVHALEIVHRGSQLLCGLLAHILDVSRRPTTHLEGPRESGEVVVRCLCIHRLFLCAWGHRTSLNYDSSPGNL